MAFLPVHQEATNATARGCKGGDGNFCFRRKKNRNPILQGHVRNPQRCWARTNQKTEKMLLGTEKLKNRSGENSANAENYKNQTKI